MYYITSIKHILQDIYREMLQFLNRRSYHMRRAGGVFALLAALMVIFALSCMLSADTENYSCQLHRSFEQLSSPENGNDSDAAVRWDYNCRVLAGLRWENRNSLRPQGVSPCHLLPNNNDLTIKAQSHNNIFICEQPENIYYRRLWQKILPSRAGPRV